MSFTTDLLAGMAQDIAAAGIGTYRSDGSVYLLDETGVVFKNLPESPDRCIVLTAYGSTDEAKSNLNSINVQIWMRGLPRQPLDVDHLGDDIFNLFQGVESRWYGTAFAVQILRKSTIQLGTDANQRWERSDNYVVDTNVPVMAGRDL